MRHKFIYLAIMAIFFAISDKVYADEIVHIPDSAFKKALINMGVDRNNDGEIQYIEAKVFKGTKSKNEVYDYKLTIIPIDIENIIGIKAFSSIKQIIIRDPIFYIDTVDISGMANIESLMLFPGKVKYVDISNCTQINYLYCEKNLIENIKMRDCINLADIVIYKNKITEIDFSTWETPPKNLRSISCPYNNITKLIVPNLHGIYAQHNNIKTFDASKLSKLTILGISNNQLQKLNMANGNNKIITNFETKNNPDLKCITVDSPEWSEEYWKDIDDWTKFSDDCSISVLETENTNIKIYPNPAQNNLFIEFNCEVKTDIEIYNIQGVLQSTQTVQTGYNFVNLDVSKLAKGSYYLKINNQIKTIILE